MTINELKKELVFWRDISILERIFPFRIRRLVRRMTGIFLLIAFVLASGIVAEESARFTGLFFLILSLWLLLLALDAIYFSKVFSREGASNFLPELSLIVFTTPEGDLIRGFLSSRDGSEALFRAGVMPADLADFVENRKFIVPASALRIEEKGKREEEYVRALIASDKNFENFLLLHNISAETLSLSLGWVFSLHRESLNVRRWWTEKRLRNLRPLGRSWAYGGAYKLEKYSTSLYFSSDIQDELHLEEINSLEAILAQDSQANALIVGEEGSGKMEIVEVLARRISDRETRFLRDFQFKVLALDYLFASHESAAGLERTLIDILSDIVSSGNIILVIPDLPLFLSGCSVLGVDPAPLLGRFLKSPDVHVIVVSDTEGFRRKIEPEEGITGEFAKIMVKGTDKKTVSKILLEEVIYLESREDVFFTYGAVKRAIASAERYFIDKPLFDASRDLLVEALSLTKTSGRMVVSEDDVDSVIRRDTGVPVGRIDDVEKTKLTHLSDLLHERIVGQDEAVNLISEAMRRTRAGIANTMKPIGSFLFLGPTGVGKTETVKALAEVFFGQEAKILRLDMTEYSTDDALNRLIGRFSSEDLGILSSMIRENQYGVLLLDEFEKTDHRVQDLFLQILDEGVFSDSFGRKISARNLMIIATSNAGSEYIFEAVERRENIADRKNEIIDRLVREGVFKPELINRFDAVVLFHPLTDEHLRVIAKLLLRRLSWRLKEKNMTLEINDALLDFLVMKGRDPKFGARPLNRAIQDNIEKIIADGIISGDYKPGANIAFTSSDLK